MIIEDFHYLKELVFKIVKHCSFKTIKKFVFLLHLECQNGKLIFFKFQVNKNLWDKLRLEILV